MNKIDILNKIILKEAPLSTYVKNLGRGVTSAAKFGTRMTGKAVGSLYDPYGGKSQKVTQPIGTFLQKMGEPSLPKTQKETPTAKVQQQTSQKKTIDTTKAKTYFKINGTQIQGKYIGTVRNKYPVYRIQGLPWAKSAILEPKGQNKMNVYLYADKNPNFKKPPAVIKPATQNYSGVQNKLYITTK
jgi:hypothetical protein